MSRRGKAARTDSERSKISQLSHENKKLKAELAKLRKTLERLDANWCPGCLKKYEEPVTKDDEELPNPDTFPVFVAPDRTCHTCHADKLILIKYFKMGEAWYIRRCPSCKYQTKGKKYTPDVQD
jgi:hypothetical protein